jgi:rhodanese-related sulfurtransferase
LSTRSISPMELFQKLKKEESVFLLDVRAEEKFNDFHIKDVNLTTVNIPKTKIFNFEEKNTDLLPEEKEIIVTCTTGNSASKCVKILLENEYNALVLEGGVSAWKEYLKEKTT